MPSDAVERRLHTRHRVALHGSNPVVATFGVLPRAAFVHDLSATGIAVLTTEPPPVGSVVPIWLPRAHGEASQLALARVAYAEPVDRGLHRVGMASLDESSSALLATLVRELTQPPG